MARLLKIKKKRYQTWEEGVDGFILFKSAQGICDLTIKDYRYHLAKFFNLYPTSWDDVNFLRESVFKFFAQTRHLAPATHNIKRKYLKCFFSWVVKEGFLKSNPLDDIRIRHEEPRVRDLDNDKLKKLMGIFDKDSYFGLRDYAYLCLTLDTGIRPSEGLALITDNVNLKSMEVFIPSFIAKTRVSRTLPHQLALFEKDYTKQRAVDRAVDSLRERFGNGSVFRSSFLNNGVRFSTGGTMDDEEYPMMSSLL